jgi:hypothetical protein
MWGKIYIYRLFAGCKGNYLGLAYFKMYRCLMAISVKNWRIIGMKKLAVLINTHLN